ncbi:MAG: D-tyrosyl-tRNA(Tyr) deacylase [Bacteroidetes bacterium]|mgnify:FL=1|nr:D-tyrosyl-tRNA(Tyr) deacylase [Bacteroidota bacterium]MBX7238218.1 D-tyrosyl-tRNA(Tyr) deacylase [Bacteroidia bacterium]MCC7513384.1 D-tyrosyl-tRNA(Tyr) deacylase [Bacteroidia bacterium]HMU77192.1 D-aminoacyl-tRNA deacylase [Bacteroidia bacterium]HMX97517.1 D-aminoacyl-tRNA deacylase [Bacteroidia bacterium]
MKVVIQRVTEASVEIEEAIYSSIKNGLLVLLGISVADEKEDVDWLCKKIIGLRIFSDENELMNLSVKDINGQILLVSQFTLYGDANKGNRPSFIQAARPEKAIPLYEYFIQQLCKNDINVYTGKFGADMKVSLTNDGPVTIIIDSKKHTNDH